jgi:hypothetical protein
MMFRADSRAMICPLGNGSQVFKRIFYLKGIEVRFYVLRQHREPDFLLPKRINKKGGYSYDNYPDTVNETNRTYGGIFIRNGPSGFSFEFILGF